MKQSISARLTQLIEEGVTPHYSYENNLFSDSTSYQLLLGVLTHNSCFIDRCSERLTTTHSQTRYLSCQSE